MKRFNRYFIFQYSRNHDIINARSLAMFLGTAVNGAAVMAGSLLGILFSKKIPAAVMGIIFQALGLCTIAIGIVMILKMDNILVIIFSLVIGGIMGELLR